MRRPLVTVAIAASLAALAVPFATSARDVDRSASAPTTTESKSIETAAPASVEESPFDPEGLVAAAQSGYAEFIAAFGSAEFAQESDSYLAECPWISPADLVAALAPIGATEDLEAEVRANLEADETEPDGDAPAVWAYTVTCDTRDYSENNDDVVGPVYGIGVGIFDLSEAPSELEGLAEFVESTGGTVLEPSAETFGGTVYGYCDPDDDMPVGSTNCYQLWIVDAFVIGLTAIVDEQSEAPSLDLLEVALLDELPPLLQRLADGIPPVDIVPGDDDDDGEVGTDTVTEAS